MIDILISPNLDKLKLRLQQVFAWGKDKYDVTNLQMCLRSEELKPSVHIGNQFKASNYERYQAVEDLALKREEILKQLNPSNQLVVSGRLLCFYPDWCLIDGFVAMDSGNFIDYQNCPPWDTWLYFSLFDLEKSSSINSQGIPCLLSWVPEAAVELIDKAKIQDANECLIWAVETEKLLNLEKL